MKSKQVLDVQQMQHLQELGMKMDYYDTLYSYVKFEDSDWLLKPSSDLNIIGISCKYIPAYTLQDMLDALPKMIYPFPTHKIGFELWIGSGKIFYANMFNSEDVSKIRDDEELIDAAYELLVWCIEQGYIETNKNE